jgi:hypothetical protein
MTVQELIDELQKTPPDVMVYDCVASEVTRVRVFEKAKGHLEDCVIID